VPLGCSRHKAAVYDRGGKQFLGSLDLITQVKYSRVRDDMSSATLTVDAVTPECTALLAQMEPNRHEVVIFRDGQRVWEGPISWIEFTSTGANIEAKDITYYFYRLIQTGAYDNSKDPSTPGEVTRNLVANPSFEANLTGVTVPAWVTLTRVGTVNALPGASGSWLANYAVTSAPANNNSEMYQTSAHASIAAMAAQEGWGAVAVRVRGFSGIRYATLKWECRDAGSNILASATTPMNAIDGTVGALITATARLPVGTTNVRWALRFFGTAAGGNPPVGSNAFTDSWIAALAPTQSDALDQVTPFFDGSKSSTPYFTYAWDGAASNSTSTRTRLIFTKVHQRLARIIKAEIARREGENPPVNVLPYGLIYTSGSDTQTRRSTPAYCSTVYEELDNMAEHAGLDYTVIGRRLVMADVHTVFHTTPEVSEADFRGDVIVTAYGMQMASVAAATDGNGVYGVAGAPDPYYGSWEVLVNSTNEEGDTSTTPTTPDPSVFADQARAALAGTNPVPYLVRLPENTSLVPGGRLSFDDLVPGARVPLRATLTARRYSMMQKLDSVTVTDSKDGEDIQISLSQASALDVPVTGSYNLADA